MKHPARSLIQGLDLVLRKLSVLLPLLPFALVLWAYRQPEDTALHIRLHFTALAAHSGLYCSLFGIG